MINSREIYNPFNHGTTSINYEDSSTEEYKGLIPILENGWGIRNPSQFRRMVVGFVGKARYFKFDYDGDAYFFNRNRPDHRRQCLIDSVQDFCRRGGILTRDIVSTLDGENNYLDSNTAGTYSLSKFIDGENFDGSRTELLQAASELALMHRLLENIPNLDDIRISPSLPNQHDPETLAEELEKLKMAPSSELSKLCLPINEIEETSRKVELEAIDNLRMQAVHGDFHPHNLLFDAENRKLLAIVDFEQVRYSQRIRDVGFAMHRLSRTYGSLTERTQDIDSSIHNRAREFITNYVAVNPLDSRELKSLVSVLQDEALIRITLVLKGFYSSDPEKFFELNKQITMLREAELFSNL